MTDSYHQCPGPACKARVPRGKLMCPGCWAQVPKPLQAEVYAAWNRGRGAGTERHTAAICSAIEAVTP